MGVDGRLFDIQAKRYFDFGRAHEINASDDSPACAFGCGSVYEPRGICFGCLMRECSSRIATDVSRFVLECDGATHRFFASHDAVPEDDMYDIARAGGYSEWAPRRI